MHNLGGLRIARTAYIRIAQSCGIVRNQGGTMPTSKPDNEDAQWVRGGQCIKCPGFEMPSAGNDT